MRSKVVAALLLVPAFAHANGSMGLGLEIWSLESWAAYCVAMVLLEAWLIGNRAKMAFPKALLISLSANFVTGMVCGPLGCCAAVLHPMSVNPNPLAHSLVLLLAFAVPSGLIESLIWIRFVEREKQVKLIGWSVLVHLLTIPIGWAILMIPERPYRGLELNASVWRGLRLRQAGSRITYYSQDSGHLPRALDANGLLEETKQYSVNSSVPLNIECFFSPAYGRFATGEDFAHPFTFNRRIVGKSPLQISKLTKKGLVPYATADSTWGDVTGLFYNVTGQSVERRDIPKGDPNVDWDLK